MEHNEAEASPLPTQDNLPLSDNLSDTSTPPHTLEPTLYEAKKTLLLQSLDMHREYCKSMIPITTGIIPLYIILINNVLSETDKRQIPFIFPMLVYIPCTFFIIVIICFIKAYFNKFNGLEIIALQTDTQVKDAIQHTIHHRRKFLIMGNSIFLFGLLVSFMCVNLSAKLSFNMANLRTIDMLWEELRVYAAYSDSFEEKAAEMEIGHEINSLIVKVNNRQNIFDDVKTLKVKFHAYQVKQQAKRGK